jgi:hypothetical protein
VRGCHGVEDNYNTTLQGHDITESYINLTTAFPTITFNMRTGPWQPTNIESGQNFIRNCGSPPNFKLAVTLAAMAAAGVMPAGLNGSAGIFLAAAPASSIFNTPRPADPPWSSFGPLSSLVANSSEMCGQKLTCGQVWINMAWTLGFNSGRSASQRARGELPVQIVLDASLPDAADGAFLDCLYCLCDCFAYLWLIFMDFY